MSDVFLQDVTAAGMDMDRISMLHVARLDGGWDKLQIFVTAEDSQRLIEIIDCRSNVRIRQHLQN